MLRSPQDFLHWLETGAGARFFRLFALVLGVLSLAALVSWKQFRGPSSESTLAKADLARQLALGQGFTTLINLPQSAAVLAGRGHPFRTTEPYPELHQAPLYPLVLAGFMVLVPKAKLEALFAFTPSPPDGYGGDYLLLAANLLLLACALGLAGFLASRLFSPRAGWIAALACLVSASVWQRTLSLEGSLLLSNLLLAAFHCLLSLAQARRASRASQILPLLALGVLGGLLFLAEYVAGCFLLLALVPAGLGAARGRRWSALLLVLLPALLLVSPWLLRNHALTGHPLALARHGLALKAGDPTAEPSVWRGSYSADTPVLSLPKVANKLLTCLQDSLRSRFWSDGGLVFTAFFAAGLLYRHRAAHADGLRWFLLGTFALVLVAHGLCNPGDGDLHPTAYFAPLFIVFGTGFLLVLVESSPLVSSHPRLALASILGLQALPLLHDVTEPRRHHFSYPPYFPPLFVSLKEELIRRSPQERFGLMADVPAGVAWYGRQRAWSQPPRLRDYFAITVEQPIAELLLTPRTLDRPFFSELVTKPVLPGQLGLSERRFGEWGLIYTGLFTGHLPKDFPLQSVQKLADNLYVLVDPVLLPIKGK